MSDTESKPRRKTGGFGPSTHVIPTRMFHDVFAPILKALDEQLGRDTLQGGQEDFTTQHGGSQWVADHVGPKLGILPHSFLRRLYDINHLKHARTDFGTADAIMCALGEQLSSHPLPVLPNSRKTALEMILVYHELRDEPIETAEAQRLADTLYNVAHGILAACADGMEEAAAAFQSERDRPSKKPKKGQRNRDEREAA